MDCMSCRVVALASLLLAVAANKEQQNLSFSIPVQYSLLSAQHGSPSYETVGSSYQVAAQNPAYQAVDNALDTNQQAAHRYAGTNVDWSKYASSLPQYSPVGALYQSASANAYPQNTGGSFHPSTYYGTLPPSYQSTYYQVPSYRRNAVPSYHRNSHYPARYQTTPPTSTPSILDTLDFLDYKSPMSKQDVIGHDESGVNPSNPLYALLVPLVLLGISIPAIGFMYTYLHRRRRSMDRSLQTEDLDYYLELLQRSLQCMEKKNC